MRSFILVQSARKRQACGIHSMIITEWQSPGANRSILRSRATAEDGRWRWSFRCRGSRHGSAAAQLFS
jgi:hypothetical protein